MWDVHTLQIWGESGAGMGHPWRTYTESPRCYLSPMFSRKFSESKAVFVVGPGMSRCVALGP